MISQKLEIVKRPEQDVDKTVTLRRLCYRGPLRGAGAPKKRVLPSYIIMRRRRVVRGGATWGRELGAGAFSVSPQGRALRTRLWHILWVGRGKEGPLIRRGSRRDTFPRRGEGFGGSWKPAGDIGPLRRGGACPRLSLACSVTGTGEGGPLIRHGSRRHTFPPVGGGLLGRLEACGRFWASAQGRGLPPPVSGMFCDWYGGRRTPHPSRLAPPHLPPTGGRLLGRLEAAPHECSSPDRKGGGLSY